MFNHTSILKTESWKLVIEYFQGNSKNVPGLILHICSVFIIIKTKKMPCIWISRLVSKVLFKSCVCVSCSVVSNSLQPHGLYVNIYMNSPGKSTGMGCHFLLQGSSWLRNQTWVFCIEGRFFTIWVTREARWLLNLKGILKIWF